MVTVTESTRDLVWQELLDVSRLTRYYSALARRYQWYHYATRVPLLLFASASVSSALYLLPKPVYVIAGVFVAILVVADYVGDFAKKAAILSVIALQCSRLEAEAHRQWGLVHENQIGEEEAQNQITEFDRRVSEVTSWPSFASIPDNERLNKQCAKDCYTVIGGKYEVTF